MPYVKNETETIFHLLRDRYTINPGDTIDVPKEQFDKEEIQTCIEQGYLSVQKTKPTAKVQKRTVKTETPQSTQAAEVDPKAEKESAGSPETATGESKTKK